MNDFTADCRLCRTTEIRVDGSYVYMHPASHVQRAIHVRHDLLVDLLPDGRVAGVERVGAPVTAEDLAAVLFALPFPPSNEGDRA